MRGADVIVDLPHCLAPETSPHAWSRFETGEEVALGHGNISTCVEQIGCISSRPAHTGKHLHMRRADWLYLQSTSSYRETSPHAWSRSFAASLRWISSRNISTCVEQIALLCRHRRKGRKHLHMRGADLSTVQVTGAVVETSPHAWSRFPTKIKIKNKRRNISTCVEQMTQRDDFENLV